MQLVCGIKRGPYFPRLDNTDNKQIKKKRIYDKLMLLINADSKFKVVLLQRMRLTRGT